MPQSMTLAQTPFWQRFVQQPDNNVDTVAHCVVIRGELDLPVFSLAIERTLAETEVFRTRFSQSGQMRIAPLSATARVAIYDLASEPNPAQRAWQAMEHDAQQAVNLREQPITAHRLYKISEQLFYWYTRAHHILIDGYGMMLFEQRCCQWYQHLAHAQPLTAAFKPYADYLAEEARYLTSADYTSDHDFWQHYVGHQEMLTLSAASYDPNASCDVCHQVLFDPHFAARLRAICQRLAIGWPDALVALTALYLQQSPVADGDQSVVWLPFMNRWGSVAANIPGLMVNILPYQHKQAPLTNLQDYLLHCRTALRELYCHGRYRIEQIEHDQKLSHEHSYFMTPFINVMPFDAPSLPGCHVEQHVLAAGSEEGLNFTFRGAPGSEPFCLFIEADINSYPQANLDQHVIELPAFFERLLGDVDPESLTLESLLNRPLEPLFARKLTLAKSA